MHTLGTFALYIRPGDTLTPARVRVMIQDRLTNEDGRLFITPECTWLDELEGQINALQDDLDEIRARALSAGRLIGALCGHTVAGTTLGSAGLSGDLEQGPMTGHDAPC